MDRTNNLSRHFLGTQPHVLRSIPFAKAGAPDEDGFILKHSLLALADWNQDNEVRTCACVILLIADWDVSGEKILSPVYFPHCFAC